MIEQEKLLLNPFPGLRPFRFKESYLFFGRDGQSDQVLTKLRTARFVAVVGTSGSGKSSLVSAGLLPALFSGHMPSAGSSWRIANFRPGSSPIKNLALALGAPDVFGSTDSEVARERQENIERTLRRSSLGLLEVVNQSRMDPTENLLILADQFEELFRFRKKSTEEHPDDEAAAFVRLLLEAKQADRPAEKKLPIYVILTMRSDYLGDCAHFWGLPEAINEGQFLIPRMTDDNRREAITGPVIIGGAEITPTLVNRLLNDAGDDPAQLPILQHALMRTWDYWKNDSDRAGPIDISHYEKIGGINEALSNHADEAFWDLSPELQEVASKVFKSLTEKEADHREGRRPATVGEIASAAEATEDQVRTVIESFRREDRSFLMPPPPEPLTSDRLIDISHESLIRGWVRLRAWVDEEAQAARQYLRLADTAALFPQEVDYLRDPALQIALNWLKDNKPTRAWAERYHPGFEKALAYLNESKTNRENEIAEKERLHREKVEEDLRHAEAIAIEQRRRVKQLRWGLALLSLLLIGMFAATVYAFQQKNYAVLQKGEADKQKNRAEQALKDVEVQRDSARQAQASAEKQKGVAEGALATAKEERDKATKAEAETARQRDAAELQRAEAEKQTKIAKAATSEAERQRLSAETAFSQESLARREAVRSEQAAQLATETARKERDRAKNLLDTVTEIDLSAPYTKAVLRGQNSELRSLALSPDGRFLATAGKDNLALVWEANTGKTLATYNQDGPVSGVAFSHDGNLIATASDNGKIGIWDVKTATNVKNFGSADRSYTSVVFSPDDQWIASIANAKLQLKRAHASRIASYDDLNSRELSIVELRSVSGDKTLTLSGHTGTINSVAFSHKGKLLVTASADQTARVWDAVTGKSVAVLRGHLSGVNTAEFSPDDKLVVTASNDGLAHVWDANSGEILVKRTLGPEDQRALEKSALNHRAPVTSARFSANGNYIVTTSGNNAYLWAPESANQWAKTSADSPTILKGHEGAVTNAVFSENGKFVVTISQDRTARVWRAETLSRTSQLEAPTAESLAIFRGHIKPLTTVEISKDSKYVITGSEDRTARVWDLTGVGALTMTALELKAEPAEYSGRCPVTISFTGIISIAGKGGTVKYKFVRSDGSESLPQELVFDGPGSQGVSTAREMFFTGVNRAGRPLPEEGWLEIQTIEPVVMTSNRAAFKVVCDEPGDQTFVTDVTVEELAQIMPNADRDKLALYLPYLQKAMAEFGINTSMRRAEFLAEIAHETIELRYLEELDSGERYEGRKDLGNIQPGDGKRFKGRGAFLLTGRSNYQRYGEQLGVDLIARPELAASPEVAFRSAALFWQASGLNELADKSDTPSIHRRINGGSTGLEEVQKYATRARNALGAKSLE